MKRNARCWSPLSTTLEPSERDHAPCLCLPARMHMLTFRDRWMGGLIMTRGTRVTERSAPIRHRRIFLRPFVRRLCQHSNSAERRADWDDRAPMPALSRPSRGAPLLQQRRRRPQAKAQRRPRHQARRLESSPSESEGPRALLAALARRGVAGVLAVTLALNSSSAALAVTDDDLLFLEVRASAEAGALKAPLQRALRASGCARSVRGCAVESQV